MAEDELELFREPSDVQTSAEDPVSTAPRVFAVAGAKGGVGKSLFAANLGVYLATIGRRVMVVDADATGANLHGFLGVPHPGGIAPYDPPRPVFLGEEADLDEVFESDDEVPEEDEPKDPDPAPLVDVAVPGLTLLHAGLDEPSPGTRADRRAELQARVRSLEVDDVVLDLGAGTEPSLLDAWIDADLRIFVTLPEPTAVEATYRFVRSAFERRLTRELGPVQRADLDAVLETMGRAPAPADLARRLEALNHPLLGAVRDGMSRMRMRFVVNQARLRSDLELGEQMVSAARRRLSVGLEYLGYIDYDDTVWNCLRAGRPLLVESPGTKASRNIEKIARNLLALDAGKRRPAPLPNAPEHTHHDLLEVDRGATEEEVRRAYKRAKEIYAPGALASSGLFDAVGQERLRSRLEEAHDVLLDPVRRRPYELSVFPPQSEAPSAIADEPPPLGPAPPPPVITPETEFTGGLLRAVRESQGIRLRDVSRRTKIGMSFLKAIEEDDYANLPATVYIRGFVTEIAKCLSLDPEHVSRTYVRRAARAV